MLIVGIILPIMPILMGYSASQLYNIIPLVMILSFAIYVGMTGGEENHRITVGLNNIMIFPLSVNKLYRFLVEKEYLANGIIFIIQSLVISTIVLYHSGLFAALYSFVLYVCFAFLAVNIILALKLLLRDKIANGFMIIFFILMLLFQLQIIISDKYQISYENNIAGVVYSFLWKGFQYAINGDIIKTIPYIISYLLISGSLLLLSKNKLRKFEY